MGGWGASGVKHGGRRDDKSHGFDFGRFDYWIRFIQQFELIDIQDDTNISENISRLCEIEIVHPLFERHCVMTSFTGRLCLYTGCVQGKWRHLVFSIFEPFNKRRFDFQ